MSAPTITTLSPDVGFAGSESLNFAIIGTGFTSEAVAYWARTALTTTVNSATELAIQGPASLIATTGKVTVTVRQAGAASNGVTFTVNPRPKIAGVSPNEAIAGGAAFMLTVNGADFIQGMVVGFGDTLLATTFVSATQLTASVPANLIATAGDVTLAVQMPWEAGLTTVPFAILNPKNPTITALSPESGFAGPGLSEAGFAIVGTNFTAGAIAYWGGTALATTVNSATEITAQIPEPKVGAETVTVKQAGATSNGVPFAINPAPTIDSFNPSEAVAGGAAFTLTVNGANFIEDMVVAFGDALLATTFVSATQLTASVAASRIATPGAVNVAVQVPWQSALATKAFTIYAFSTTAIVTIAGTSPADLIDNLVSLNFNGGVDVAAVQIGNGEYTLFFAEAPNQNAVTCSVLEFQNNTQDWAHNPPPATLHFVMLPTQPQIFLNVTASGLTATATVSIPSPPDYRFTLGVTWGDVTPTGPQQIVATNAISGTVTHLYGAPGTYLAEGYLNITSSQPQPGELIVGDYVTVGAVSTVLVPNVFGFLLQNAESAIQSAGLSVGDIYGSAPSNQAVVTQQAPVAGTSVVVGFPINLTIRAAAGVLVPNVFGLLLQNAEGVIQSAGLSVGSIVGPALVPDDQSVVTNQTPGAGESVPPGTPVKLAFQATTESAASDVNIINNEDFAVVCYAQAIGAGSWSEIDALDPADSTTFTPASGVTYLLAAVSNDTTQGCTGADPSTADSFCIVSQTGVTGGGKIVYSWPI